MIQSGDFEIDIDEGHYPGEVNTNLHNWAGMHWDTGLPYVSGLPLSEEFHTRALEWTPTEMIYYFDGQEIRRVNYSNADVDPSKEVAVRFSTAVLDWAGEITNALDGTSMDIDYVRVYAKEQTPKAENPTPQNSARNVLTQTGISWLPGYAAEEVDSYDVYFGNSYDAVANAYRDSAEFVGNQIETVFTADALVQGETYYWRIDELVDGVSYAGEVWSFTTWKPNPNIIDPESLTATASNTSIYGHREPLYAVNAAGLTEDCHSNAHADYIMWMADKSSCWFKVDLGYSYCLDYMRLWNYNMSGYTGRGINQADVYYSNSLTDPGNPSDNPEAWRMVGQTGRVFKEASGRADYGVNENYSMPDIVDMYGIMARWVLIDIKSNHAQDSFTGISEVRFAVMPASLN